MNCEITTAQDPNWNDEARIRCEFTLRCPKVWNRLQRTAVEGVRYCSECDRDVFLVLTEKDLQRYANAGHCVAIPVKGEGESDWYVGHIHPSYDSRENGPYGILRDDHGGN